MRKYVKIIVKRIIFSILIFIGIGAITTSSVKNVMTIIKIQSFKKNAEFQSDLSTRMCKYYMVEGIDDKGSFTVTRNSKTIGVPGDIICSTKSSVPIPLVKDIVTYFAGGHAAFSSFEYEDYENRINEYEVVETTGLEGSNNYCKTDTKDYWDDPGFFDEVIGLRTYRTDEELREVSSVITGYIGDEYNYSFIFDTTDKKYCTDILSQAFKYIGVNLNKDGFSTSVYDLIVSSDVYIFYYSYYDGSGVRHVYYSE